MSQNDPNTNPAGDGEVVNVTEVRAGFRDRPMLWVLGIGTVLVFIALFGAWALFSGGLAQGEARRVQPSEASTFDAEPPARPTRSPGGVEQQSGQ